MTREEFGALFETHNEEYLHFERVEHKIQQRPDLYAFVLLDGILPGTGDMVCAAEHDEIWLDIEVEDLINVITPAQVITLIRCGVRFDRFNDCLGMFT